MFGAVPNDRFPFAESNPVRPVNWLAERVRHYFDLHPGIAREKFLLEALRREIDFCEQQDVEHEAGRARRACEGTQPAVRRSAPAQAHEDIRLHAWLSERLAVLHYERHGLWPKLRRLLFDNRLGHWLGLQPQPAWDGAKAMVAPVKGGPGRRHGFAAPLYPWGERCYL